MYISGITRICYMNNLSVPYLFLFLHNELRKLTTLQLKHTLTAPPRSYPASSWFFLRQTREKRLRATVYFPIENAQVRHASRDTFDVNFICQFIFHLNAKFSPKALTKNDLYLRFPLSCGFAELVEHNTPDPPPNNNSKQYNRQQFARAPSRD